MLAGRLVTQEGRKFLEQISHPCDGLVVSHETQTIATHSHIHKANAFLLLLPSKSIRLRSCCDPWPRATSPAVLVWWWPLSRRASPSPMPRATWRRVPPATSSTRTTRNGHAARRTIRPNAAPRPKPSPAKTAAAIASERTGARRRERWNVSSPEAAIPPQSAPKQTSA